MAQEITPDMMAVRQIAGRPYGHDVLDAISRNLLERASGDPLTAKDVLVRAFGYTRSEAEASDADGELEIDLAACWRRFDEVASEADRHGFLMSVIGPVLSPCPDPDDTPSGVADGAFRLR
ncbi:hypothetical protein CKO28_18885 [Rhodovibrio sodomensis]|uniref:Uncharacterized protein n=2 Tax=Rhodovibrio sodomensis TaxID=1088 RepID=A0ABS1DHZ9_9PROT|nr:hypothetical protein [Rhodovibrio sodomensis]